MTEQLYEDVNSILQYYTRLGCLCDKGKLCLPCRAKRALPALKTLTEELASYREALEDIGATTLDNMDRTIVENALAGRRK